VLCMAGPAPRAFLDGLTGQLGGRLALCVRRRKGRRCAVELVCVWVGVSAVAQRVFIGDDGAWGETGCGSPSALSAPQSQQVYSTADARGFTQMIRCGWRAVALAFGVTPQSPKLSSGRGRSPVTIRAPGLALAFPQVGSHRLEIVPMPWVPAFAGMTVRWRGVTVDGGG
jgi:hypothetical protein